MWTINIRDKAKSDEQITVQVEFVNGEESIVRNFSSTTLNGLRSKIKRYKGLLEERDANFEQIPTGEYTLPANETSELTQDEQARATWEEDRQKLENMQRLVDMGVFTGEEQGIVDLRDKVRSAWKREYMQ